MIYYRTSITLGASESSVSLFYMPHACISSYFELWVQDPVPVDLVEPQTQAWDRHCTIKQIKI